MKKDGHNRSVGKSRITSNMEDYLETIHELSLEQKGEEVRVTDLARRLRVTRPSVVGMLRHLGEHGLVVHGHYGRVELTSDGRLVAVEIAGRHRVLRRFLEEVLGLDAEIAEEDACRMEHHLSAETIDRFVAFEAFRESAGEDFKRRSEGFRKFLRARRQDKKEPSRRTDAVRRGAVIAE
jgi:DtxR family Mn-dependent transcriptional regulator